MPAVIRSAFLVAASLAVVVLAAGCDDDEPAEPPTRQAATRGVEPAAPSATASEPKAAEAASPADTPLPPRPAAEPPTPGAPAVTPTKAAGRVQPRPSPTAAGVELHDSQVVTSVGQKRDNMAPWRDNGANRLFSTHVFGTPFMLNEKGELLPWIATGITSNDELTVWTMKLREDAVFQDGTPITAADFKAYWEHGARPENIAAWRGASLSLGFIQHWGELTDGYVAESDNLRAVDDHTLEIELAFPVRVWPLYMAAWHVGISKLEQVLADDNWGNAPIGAGPFSLTYHPETGLTELTRTDLVGGHWNGPHDRPTIEKLVVPNIEDVQARLIMFENGALDLVRIDTETYQAGDPYTSLPPDILPDWDVVTHRAAVDPNHPLLYVSPYAGLHFVLITNPYPLARQALAHGVDMQGIVSAIWGPTAIHAKGLITSTMPCHDPDPDHQPYDPDLARQKLSAARQNLTERERRLYGNVSTTLMIDLYRPDMVAMGVAMKEYWKDNLGVELDILKLESGVARREWTHLERKGLSSWIPDPFQAINEFIRPPSVLGFGENIDSRWRDISDSLGPAFHLPVDDPDRCRWFQKAQQGFLEELAFVIPIKEIDGGRWLVQPWLRGFKSTFNQDFNTLITAYVARH